MAFSWCQKHVKWSSACTVLSVYVCSLVVYTTICVLITGSNFVESLLMSNCVVNWESDSVYLKHISFWPSVAVKIMWNDLVHVLPFQHKFALYTCIPLSVCSLPAGILLKVSLMSNLLLIEKMTLAVDNVFFEIGFSRNSVWPGWAKFLHLGYFLKDQVLFAEGISSQKISTIFATF